MKRGLAQCDPETRKRVAQMGGSAPHKSRGLQNADEGTKKLIAAMGGKKSKRRKNGHEQKDNREPFL